MFAFLLLIILFDRCSSSDDSYIEVESCDSIRCQLPYCYCSNQSIPGGLSIRNTPQFISININGPVDKRTYNLLKDIFFSNKYYNPDGLLILFDN